MKFCSNNIILPLKNVNEYYFLADTFKKKTGFAILYLTDEFSY